MSAYIPLVLVVIGLSLQFSGVQSEQTAPLTDEQKACAGYQSAIDQELKKQCDNDPTCKYRVEDVFYSSKAQSCLYAFYRERVLSTGVDDPKAQITGQWAWYLINDFLNKKILYTSKMIDVKDGAALEAKRAEFDGKIKEFKE